MRPSPAVPRRARRLLRSRVLRLFNRLSFRVKFVSVGVLVAAPLCLMAAYVAAASHDTVRQARERERALWLGGEVRELLSAVAVHRGFSAGVLAGGERLRSSLVAHQSQMRAKAAVVERELSQPRWHGLLPGGQAPLAAEVDSLLSMPDSLEPERNFERHNELIDRLMAVIYRLGLTVTPGERWLPDAAAYDTVFYKLPALIEQLSRQRGWGSAVLTLGQFSAPELHQFMLYAGTGAQHTRQLLADRHTLDDLADVLPAMGAAVTLGDALNEANVFIDRSLAQLLSQQAGDDAAAQHYQEGQNAIAALQDVNQRLSAALLDRAQQARETAEQQRAVAYLVLSSVLLLIAALYLAFERSTVTRLRSLQRASTRLAAGDFDRHITVDGSDEIAELGQSLDRMRSQLHRAVNESADALAARASARARTEFLARWSHDLRTPLSAVLGYAHLLADRAGDAMPPDQRADLRRIELAGEHLLALVNDVLEIASTDAREVLLRDEPVDLPTLARDAIDLVSGAAQAQGIEIALETPPQPLAARGDHTRLLQVVTNLLSNAVKFNRHGGHVRVRIVAGGQDQVRVEVSDSGDGIEASQLPKLFQPFERLDAAARGIPGTGLGLATVKRLVEAMGGTVHAASERGQGSRFAIDLRRAETPPPATPAEPASSAPPGASARDVDTAAAEAGPRLQGRVAYIADNEVNAMLLTAMLGRRTDIEVTVFATAEAALAAPAEPAFDLWIIDRQVGLADGLALLPQLRQRHGADLRALMFSADATPDARERAEAAGFLDFWVKPASLAQVLDSLARWMPRTPA
mgnify:CR=1 FL=1